MTPATGLYGSLLILASLLDVDQDAVLQHGSEDLTSRRMSWSLKTTWQPISVTCLSVAYSSSLLEMLCGLQRQRLTRAVFGHHNCLSTSEWTAPATVAPTAPSVIRTTVDTPPILKLARTSSDQLGHSQLDVFTEVGGLRQVVGRVAGNKLCQQHPIARIVMNDDRGFW